MAVIWILREAGTIDIKKREVASTRTKIVTNTSEAESSLPSPAYPYEYFAYETIMTAVAELPLEQIDLNTTLLNAVTTATQKGLLMAGLECKCVGVSRVPGHQTGEITGMIGVHGSVSGFVTVNLSNYLALEAVEKLLGETCSEVNSQVIDGVGEITNIIVGGIKSALGRTDWSFGQITVPSMIVGDGYQVAFARGIELIDVVFEVENERSIMVSDRLLHVTLSLLKL